MKRRLVLSMAALGLVVSCSPQGSQAIKGEQATESSSTFTKAKMVENTEDFLVRFHQNPQAVLNEIPAKTDQDGRLVHPEIFTAAEIASGQYMQKREGVRDLVTKNASATKALIDVDSGDVAEYLVDHPERLVRTLEDMDRMKLRSARLPVQPWSDDYWAIKQGILGYRYADEEMTALDNSEENGWKTMRDYVTQVPVGKYIRDGKIDLLSPAEKYDLLIGDRSNTLTQKMWDEGRTYFEENGKVEAWMGICHGWAPAANMLPRPKNAVKVRSVDNRFDITFYPSDIKSLGSLLWAKIPVETRFVGGRCNQKGPKTAAGGRVIDQECFDNNPGTWHMSVVNQIGISKRSFILDATYDYEVWNQPIVSYSYSFFNPQTGKMEDSLANAKIALGSYTKDVFKKFRADQTHSVVGIEMKLDYLAETTPVQSLTDTEANDSVTSVVYRYDLELDEYGQIIGGEWYSNAHPDFLWSPVAGAKARTPYDPYVRGDWKANEKAIHGEWAEIAREASKQGYPLGRIVEALFNVSSGSR